MASRAMLSLVSNDDDFQPRYRVLLAAKLSTTADDATVKVRELWTSGAVVEGLGLPRVGKDVLLCRAGSEAFGWIVARDEGRCVIEFEDRMDEVELLLWMRPLEEDSAPAVPPRFRRPVLRTSRPNSEEWKLIQAYGYYHRRPAFGD